MARSTTTTRKTSKAATPKADKPEAPAQTISITGRLCADPVLRHTTSSGRAVATIRVAVNDGPEPKFHSVVVWGRTAEVVCQYLKKGRLVQVSGRTQERTWRSNDGSSRSAVEINAFRVEFLSNSAPKAEPVGVAS